MLHEASQRPAVWRFVSDNFSPSWGVVAPQLHGCMSIEEMQSAINQDVNATFIEPPIFVVATGEAAIPAIEYALHTCGEENLGGIFLSGPRMSITAGALRVARLRTLVSGVSSRGKRGKRAVVTDAEPAQTLAYREALRSCDVSRAIEDLRGMAVPVRIVAASKDRPGSAGARELCELLPNAEFFSIEQAEEDWNAYAPAHFAANVAEFIFKVNEKQQKNQ